jgi:hypothetical protein
LKTTRLAVFVALTLSAASCVEPTLPGARPDFVEEPGAFDARWTTVGGAQRLDGTATIDTSANGSLLVRLVGEDPYQYVTIEFFSGMNGTGVFDFGVGEHSLLGIAGVQDLNARISFGEVDGRVFYAGYGYLEIIESSPAGIVARFEFEAAYSSPTPTANQRMTGAFSAVPATF